MGNIFCQEMGNAFKKWSNHICLTNKKLIILSDRLRIIILDVTAAFNYNDNF
jgi:hypothetical protein